MAALENPNPEGTEEFSRFLLALLTPLQSRHEMSRIPGGSDSGILERALSTSEEPEEETYSTQAPSRNVRKFRKVTRYFRKILFALCWLTLTGFLMMYEEKDYEPQLISIPNGKDLNYQLNQTLTGQSLILKLKGSFMETICPHKPKEGESYLALIVQEMDKDTGLLKNLSQVQYFNIKTSQFSEIPNVIDKEKIIMDIKFDMSTNNYQLKFFTSRWEQPFSMELFIVSPSISPQSCLSWGLISIFIIYLNLAFELVHRTFAGIISCCLLLAILAAGHLRLTLYQIFQLIDMNIVMSFFGMSIIIELLAETGLQDYLAAVCYEMANGHIWPLLNFVFLISWGLSTIFDEIMLILFLAPICLRLCEIMHLNCTAVLSCLIIALNVGSILTPASSTTNSLIFQHPLLQDSEVGFSEFTLHMLPVTVLALAQSYIHLRLLYSDSQKLGTLEPLQVERLKRLTRLWRKVSDRMGGYSLDERTARDTVDTRVRSLRKRLKRLGKMPIPPQGFEEKVQKLRDSFPVQRYAIVIACLTSLAAVFLLSIANLTFASISITIGWLAVIAALLALSVSNFKDIEGILSRIDWATMLLLSCLFILMEVLVKLGLRDALTVYLEELLVSVQETQRLMVAILSVIWISAGLTTLLYNVPVINMMLPIIVTIAANEQLNVPLKPMIWSLVLGCCLGGNGSIMAAVVNIAGAGVASKHGYRITYMGYLKIGFLVMVGNVLVATCYLLLAHVLGHWH